MQYKKSTQDLILPSLSIKNDISIVFLVMLFMFTNLVFAESADFIDFTPNEPVEFSFKSIDPSGNVIPEMNIVESLAKALSQSSHMPFKSVKDKYERPIFFISGIRVRLLQNKKQILLEYLNREKMDTGEEYGQSLFVPVDYKIEQTADKYKLILTQPKKASLVTNRLLILPPPKLASVDDAVSDAKYILSSIDKLKLQLNYNVKGEVDSNYKPESVMGNFERLLGRYSVGNRSSKNEGVFKYKVDSKEIPLNIFIYPYHDGSKVTYDANLSFSISANEDSSGYDVKEKLISDLETVVNN